MRTKNLLLISLLVATLASFGQNELEFHFDQARAFLAKREVSKAIESLRIVYVEDTNHANINFLMGAAYTEMSGHQEQALYHLKKAVQEVNPVYKVGSFKERGAPLHVYYYLTVAYVENDQCALANQAFQQFIRYKSKVDEYYIAEADRHLQKCPFDPSEPVAKWDKITAPPSNYKPSQMAKQVEEELVDSAALAERGMLIKKLEYTTNAPLYGVQIGSNINPSPISSYGKLKNVDAFVDNKGMIRYVVGHFSYYSQAESLLKKLREEGYHDAFVVNVNDERKYTNELVSYRNINLKAGIVGEVEYFVQLGAFEEEIPADFMEAYLKIEGVEEINYQGLTVIVVGPFADFKVADQKQIDIASKGFEDSFVVAFNKGKKIPLDEAIKYTR
jgi:hypothetical protein